MIKLNKSSRRLLLIAFLMLTSLLLNKYGARVSVEAPNLYKVSQVFDGDTIEVVMNGKPETIRFIGIDTPETQDPRKEVQCFGKAATNFTKSIVEYQSVRLESDPLSTNRDRYDRLLRYVFTDTGVNVNAEIVRQGYGFANTGFPFTKMEEFKSYQVEAREGNRGLWSSCDTFQLESGQYQTNNQ